MSMLALVGASAAAAEFPMSLAEQRACLEQSELEGAAATARSAGPCQTAEFDSAYLPFVCAKSAGAYCMSLVNRMAVPEGELVRVTSDSEQSIFLRKDYRAHLNDDPEVELVVVTQAPPAVRERIATITGCSRGRGHVLLLKEKSHAGASVTVELDTPWHVVGTTNADVLGRFVCERGLAR